MKAKKVKPVPSHTGKAKSSKSVTQHAEKEHNEKYNLKTGTQARLLGKIRGMSQQNKRR